jgi:adenylate cyclase
VNEPPLEGAIVFTDLVGFTEYTATRGDRKALAVLGAQESIVSAVLPEGARVVKELGDGLLLFLPDRDAAVSTCLAILEGFDRAADADEMPLWVRAGLHWGRPSRRGHDLIGHDVNVAARIVDVAAPGELLCSGAMLTAGPSDPGSVEYVEIGPVMMKGIPDPIDLYRVERVAP